MIDEYIVLYYEVYWSINAEILKFIIAFLCFLYNQFLYFVFYQ